MTRAAAEGYMNDAALKGNVLQPKRIRPIALGIFRKGDTILVAEGYDPNKRETFYRPLGGGIEFGESGEVALAREMEEETGLAVENVRYIGACENIFNYLGEMGHEIVLLYSADFTDRKTYDVEWLDCAEDDETPFRALWKRLDDFGKDKDGPLYPDALMQLLAQHGEEK